MNKWKEEMRTKEIVEKAWKELPDCDTDYECEGLLNATEVNIIAEKVAQIIKQQTRKDTLKEVLSGITKLEHIVKENEIRWRSFEHNCKPNSFFSEKWKFLADTQLEVLEALKQLKENLKLQKRCRNEN